MKSSIARAATFILIMAASLWFAGCGGSSDEKPSTENQVSDSENEKIADSADSFYPPGGPIEVEKDDPMGDFTATDINGNRVALSDYKGKVVLLDFWASWCSPCEREIPNMKKVYDKYRDKGFEIIGVSLDHDQESLNEFLRANDVDWVQIFTGHGWETPIAVHYSVKAIPEPWLIGKDGRLITKEARGEYLESLVKQALKEDEALRLATEKEAQRQAFEKETEPQSIQFENALAAYGRAGKDAETNASSLQVRLGRLERIASIEVGRYIAGQTYDVGKIRSGLRALTADRTKLASSLSNADKEFDKLDNVLDTIKIINQKIALARQNWSELQQKHWKNMSEGRKLIALADDEINAAYEIIKILEE